MRIFKVFASVAVVSSLLLMAGCGSGTSTSSPPNGQGTKATLEKTNITVGLSLPACTYLPIYVADQQGLFKQQGLNVKVLTFAGGTSLAQALAAGSVDIAVGGLADVVNSIKNGADFKVFYCGLNYASFGWYSKDISSFKDGKGKRFSVSKFGSETDFLTRYALIASGLDPTKDVQILQTGTTASTMAALASGQVDVAVLAPPYTFLAEQKGYKEILKLGDLTPDFPYHTMYAKDSFLKNDPGTIKVFLKAYVKAVDLAKTNKSLSVSTLEKVLKYTPQESSACYDEIINNLYADGRLPVKGMTVFWQMALENHEFTAKMPQSTWLDPTYINTYNQWK